MNRPCLLRHPEPVPGRCRACWLYCNDERYRKLWSGEPGLLKKAANFAAAVTAHARSGFKTLSADEVDARLAACATCAQNNGGRCAACGCFLAAKAKWATQDCPLGRWPLACIQPEPSGG